MADESIEQTKEKGAVQTYDEKRLKKYRSNSKKYNNGSLFLFGVTVIWLLLLKYTDVDIIIGPVKTLAFIILFMAVAILFLILSAFYMWRFRTLRKEIEYYSIDPEPEDDSGQTEIPE